MTYAQGINDAAHTYSPADGAPPSIEVLAEDYVECHPWDDETAAERAVLAREWAEGWHARASREWARHCADIAAGSADA